MTPDLRRHFNHLAPLPPEARAAELDSLALPPDLRLELEQLLAADSLTDGLIERPIRDAANSLATTTAPLQLGVWRTTGLLGQGGMGVVYKAERTDGTVEQTAAIKLLYRGLETQDLLARFQRERTILARLSHPNIARFLDAGATPEGLPWFAMEFVDGTALDRYCDAKNLSPEARVRLLIQVCAAVQHAHGHLVIHRDIKPDNILVTADGTPVLLDFGIAQILGETRPGAPVTRAMTPDYASPEQLRGDPATTSTDVYLLGAVLNRILGTLPLGDLTNIVRRAMHVDPARRYTTPTELAADLTAWLNGLPVAATPDSFFYRTHRFIARHRWPVAIAALAFLATAASALIAVNQARLAEKHFRDVRALANVFLFDFEAAIHNLEGATKARELVITTAKQYLDNLSAQDSRDPALQRELAEAWVKLARLQGGQTFASTVRRTDAIDSFYKSLRLRQALGDDRTSNPELRRTYILLTGNLITALVLAQRSAEAMPISNAAVESAEAFARDLPANRDAVRALYLAHHSRAVLCMELGNAACSIAAADRSLAVIRAWGEKHPGDRRIELDTASAELYVAQAGSAYGNYQAARDAARSMVARMERIAKLGPPTPESRRSAILAWQALGIALGAESPSLPAQPDEAADALRKALAINTSIRDKDRNNNLAQEDQMLINSLLGGVLCSSRPAEAIAVLEPLRTEILAWLEKNPDNFNVQKTLADVRNDLGRALRLTHRPELALKEHLESLALSDAILAGTPTDGISRKARVISLIRAAESESDLSRAPAALAHLDQSQQALAAMTKATPADASLSELTTEANKRREEIQKKLR